MGNGNIGKGGQPTLIRQKNILTKIIIFMWQIFFQFVRKNGKADVCRKLSITLPNNTSI